MKIGYLSIRIAGRPVGAHRIAWMLGNNLQINDGYKIDHINGVKIDNRLYNLRIATHAQNLANAKRQDRTSGLPKGICWDSSRQKYLGYVTTNGRSFRKRFDTLDDAIAAVGRARVLMHGIFANDGVSP